MVSTNVLYLDLIYFIILVCSFIPVWIFFVLGWQISSLNVVCAHNNESDLVEFFWTVVPSATVMVLCYLNLNCMTMDMMDIPMRVVKVIGRQWYWSYEPVGNPSGEYDSMMTDFVNGVDKPLPLYLDQFHQLVITSSDVIHSFSVPEFNIKTDAIPGRLNYAIVCPTSFGVYVGYCTELCGAGHAYMPIVVEVIRQPEVAGRSLENLSNHGWLRSLLRCGKRLIS